jgi:RNA polymerase sigma-70 factor (ECF subfamily)
LAHGVTVIIGQPRTNHNPEAVRGCLNVFGKAGHEYAAWDSPPATFLEENPGYHRLMAWMVLEGSDRDLIEGCRRGERDAFRALFETYQDRIYSIALRFSGDQALAMDIAQDTFLKLFSSMAEFRGDSSFGTWVYRLVVNSCLDHKRRSWRLIPLAAEVLAVLRAPGDALHGLLHSEMRGRVRSAVEKLPAEQRIVVVLRYTEGLAYEEIATVLGCSMGTVASRLNRAHKALGRRLSHLKGSSHV